MMFKFDRDLFRSECARRLDLPLSSEALEGLNHVLDQIEQDSLSFENVNQVAYTLATFKWETAHTFKPIYERGPVSYFDRYEPGTRIGKSLGNTKVGDGYKFRGRGYVQITGRGNYSRIGNLLVLDLVGNPDLALVPENAYQIASQGMKNGWFTNHTLNQHIPTNAEPDFKNARRIINGLDHAEDIAEIANGFAVALAESQQTDAPVCEPSEDVPASSEQCVSETVPSVADSPQEAGQCVPEDVKVAPQ